ncbi:MAG: DUF1223 domain-containing protein [Rickettsiales bacterium]|nr:DUF1223 domain-containing protein [Rickettsiales bacterium]
MRLSVFILCLLFSPLAYAQPHPVVVELFTSQGCSSCPAADRLAVMLAENPNVLVLSYHVNYWNKLGWTDPYSSEESTRRQRDYSRAMRLGRVYTPQMVIQGQHDVIGNQRDDVTQTIRKNSEMGPWIHPQMRREDGKIQISLPQQSQMIDTELWLIGFDKQHTTQVTAGENEGEILSHVNSVTDIQYMGKWDGIARDMAVDALKGDGIALIIQRRPFKAILGANWL